MEPEFCELVGQFLLYDLLNIENILAHLVFCVIVDSSVNCS